MTRTNPISAARWVAVALVALLLQGYLGCENSMIFSADGAILTGPLELTLGQEVELGVEVVTDVSEPIVIEEVTAAPVGVVLIEGVDPEAEPSSFPSFRLKAVREGRTQLTVVTSAREGTLEVVVLSESDDAEPGDGEGE